MSGTTLISTLPDAYCSQPFVGGEYFNDPRHEDSYSEDKYILAAPLPSNEIDQTCLSAQSVYSPVIASKFLSFESEYCISRKLQSITNLNSYIVGEWTAFVLHCGGNSTLGIFPEFISDKLRRSARDEHKSHAGSLHTAWAHLSRLKDGWDGFDAVAPSASSLKSLLSLIPLIPATFEAPEIEVDPDLGSLVLRWMNKANDLFSLSLTTSGNFIGTICGDGENHYISWEASPEDLAHVKAQLSDQRVVAICE